MHKKKKLSTSIFSFKNLIKENCIYVDKTETLYKLLEKPQGQFFLSRPRRFGKSLTLSTLEYIFKGEKELFQGLYISEQDYDWKQYPVIKLPMNRVSSSTVEEFNKRLCRTLDRIAKRMQIELVDDDATAKFGELIEELGWRDEKVVILIDEYDKPILDNILDLEECKRIRSFLKKFYGMIKAYEEYIRFTFLTGVSKFTQVSVFSDLNNLDDITMNSEYAEICGFTQEECEKYFAPWIEENSKKLQISKQAYLQKLKKLYNGVRFSEKELTLYNPVSFTKAMEQGKFKHYWFETGTPSFLPKLIKKKKFDIVKFEQLELNEDDFSSYEIERLRPEPLLYQTGYLTIVDYDAESRLFTLSYPNAEVKEAFIKYLSSFFTPVAKEETPALIEELKRALERDDVNSIFSVLNVFYAKIDYDLKIKAEKYYQSIFYILFMMLGFRIKTEVKTNKGRMDAVVHTDKNIYIFEFKLDKTVDEAIEQIKERKYYQKYLLDERNLVLIGVNFAGESGEINNWKVERK